MIAVMVSEYAWRLRTLQERALLLLVVATSAMAPLFAKIAAQGPPEIMLWITAGLAFLFLGPGQLRANIFDAALPIDAREIFAARAITALWQGMLPPTVLALAIALTQEPTGLFGALMQIFAFLSTMAVTHHFLRHRVDRSAWRILVIGVLYSAVTFAVIRYLPSMAASLLLLSAMVATIAWCWRFAPKTIQCGAATMPHDDTKVVRWLPRYSMSFQSNLEPKWWHLAFRAMFTWKALLIYGFLMVFAPINGMLVMLVGNFPLYWLILRNRTQWLHTFPISHHRRLMLALVPGIIAPLMFAGIGTLLPSIVPGMDRLGINAPDTYKQEPRYFNSPTSVSLEYWKVVPPTGLPEVIAPWGERAAPYSVKVLGMSYYNPYTSRLANTKQFAEWQFSRLTTEVYGHAISLDDYRGRYSNDEPLPPRLYQSSRIKLVTATLAILTLLLVVWMAEFSLWNKLRESVALISMVFAALTLSFVGVMFLDARYIYSIGARVTGPLALRYTVRLSETLPDSNLLLVATCCSAIFAAYWLLAFQFRRAEITISMFKERK